MISGKAPPCHPSRHFHSSNTLLGLWQEGEPAKCMWLLQEGSLHAIKHAVQWEELDAPALAGARALAPCSTVAASATAAVTVTGGA